MALNLDQLEQLTAEWKRLQPIEASRDEKLWRKLRLEWNFHSNHIEGNTLTYGETELLLVHDRASGTHELREYEEMKAHDVAIAYVRKLAVLPEDLTESNVRELNQIALKEPFWKNAITPSGESTRKRIIPGEYKQTPNNVRTATGEIFEFATPEDVPAQMPKLMETLRNAIKWEGLTLLAWLAKTHHEFTLIHPFDDGNGRVARLLTNYVLLRKHLPPLVIPSAEKKTYLDALRHADAGNLKLLTDFFGEKLIWSLELGIKAAKGESLEEPSDIEKEIALFVGEQKSQKKQVLKKDPEVVRQFLTTSVKLLFEIFDEKTHKIGEVFESRKLIFSSNVLSRGDSWQVCLESINADNLQPQQIGLNLSLRGYRGNSLHPFGLDQSIMIHLDEYEYRVETYGKRIHHAVYAEPLTTELVEEIVSDFLKKLLGLIKLQSQQ